MENNKKPILNRIYFQQSLMDNDKEPLIVREENQSVRAGQLLRNQFLTR